MTTSPLESGRRYRRVILGLFTLGIAAFLVGMLIGQSLAGLVVYVLAGGAGIVLTVVGTYRGSVLLQDERERELGRRASNVTFQLFGYAGLFGFVALVALDLTGRRTMTQVEGTLLILYAVITLTWGAIYTLLRYQR